MISSGGGGIRTRGHLSVSSVFKTDAIGRSATPPKHFGAWFYFATVSFKEARRLFNDHIKSLSESQEDSNRKGLTVSDLVELFLVWIEKNRSKDTYKSRRTQASWSHSVAPSAAAGYWLTRTIFPTVSPLPTSSWACAASSSGSLRSMRGFSSPRSRRPNSVVKSCRNHPGSRRFNIWML